MKLVARLGMVILPMIVSGCMLADQLAQRAAFSRVDFAYDRVELTKADIPLVTPNASAHLNVVLKVKNPNTIAATLDSLDYDVFLEGTKVGSGKLTETFSVPAGETKDFTVPISIPYTGLPQAALQALLNRRIQLGLKGTGHLATPVGPLDYPLELTQTFTL